MSYYYTAPSDKVFDDVKQQAIELLKTYDDSFGYATEKINRIKDLKNISDNVMFMIAMFDDTNQKIIATMVDLETREEIRKRLIAGGQPEEYIYF